MSRVWFTSDSHFGHSAIIRMTGRPFTDVEEMDRVLISNWNAIVQPNDEIWHLGDFAHRNASAAENYLRRLNGRKFLVHGNHDSEQTRTARRWVSSQPMAEINVSGCRIVLLHYAMRVWNKSHGGSLHLYGHSHGNLPGDRQSCDVSIDCWNFRPVGLNEIRARMETFPERRKHRAEGGR